MSGASNLTPFPKGTSGNPNGKPKGTANWSTVVQKLLQDEKLAEHLFKKDYKRLEGVLKRRDGSSLIAIAMMRKAIEGDGKAADWLRKTGFGDKLTLNTPDGFFDSRQTIEVVLVNPEVPADEAPAESDAEPSSTPTT